MSSFRHALGEIGAAVPDGDLASRIVGPPMHHTLRAMGLGDHADAAIAAYRADYTTRGWAMNSLFDGIPNCSPTCDAAGVRLAVATSKAEPTAQRILAHFGLDEHFEVIAGASVDGSRATQGRRGGARARPAGAAARPGADGRRPVPRRRGRRRARHRHRGGRTGVTATPTSTSPTPSPRWPTWRRSTTCARCSVSDHRRTGAKRPGYDPLHVTFICSGNICRSPMAEKMFAHQINERGPVRRGAGHQRGNRRLARRRRRRQPGQPCAARTRLSDQPPRRADRRRPSVGRPGGGAGAQSRPDAARDGRRCQPDSDAAVVRPAVGRPIRSMSRTPTTARTRTSRRCSR